MITHLNFKPKCKAITIQYLTKNHCYRKDIFARNAEEAKEKFKSNFLKYVPEVSEKFQYSRLSIL